MVVGGKPVAGEPIGAFVIPLFNSLGELAVKLPQGRLVEMAHDRFADAIVVGHHGVFTPPAPTANQTLLDERGDPPFPRLGSECDTDSARQRLLRQGIAGHGDDLEQALTFLGQGAHPLENHPIQVEIASVGRCRQSAVGQYHADEVSHQLDDEKGIASRFTDNGFGDVLPERGHDMVPIDEVIRQGADVFVRQGTQSDDFNTRLRLDLAQQGFRDTEVAVGERTAVQNEVQGGRARLPHESPQEGEAIEIGPLKIIDENHEVVQARHAHEQIAKGAERLVAQLLGIAQGGHGVAIVGDELEPAQDGKDLGQMQDAAG